MTGFRLLICRATIAEVIHLGLNSVVGVLLSLPVFLISSVAIAQETSQFLQSESTNRREVSIDAKKLSSLVDDQWETVPGEEYLRWKKTLNRNRQAPLEVSIEKAEYIAEITEAKIVTGRVIFEIRNRSQHAASLPLAPLNLHLYDLKIDSRRAIWGTGPDGKSSLLVPPGRSTVTGRWKLSGKRIFPSIARKFLRFRLNLPRSAAGSLSIVLPDGWSLKADSGIVQKPSVLHISKPSQWRIDLGHSTECVVTAMSRDPSPENKTVLFAESDTTYFLSLSGLEFQHRLQLEILGRPVNFLSLIVPAGLKIASASLGDDQNLTIEFPDPQNPRLMRIPFDVAKQGNLGPLILTGYASYPLNRAWSLPEIQLVSGIDKNSRTHLVVEAPVQIQNLIHPGFRQTDYSVLSNQRTRRSYRKNLPSAKIEVFLSRPPTRSQVEIFTHYNIQPDELQTESLIRWSSKDGSTFKLNWSLPRQWEVVSVELEGREGKLSTANWFYSDGSNSRSRSLQIDAGRAVIPGEPVLLRLSCRRSLKEREVPLEFRLLNPLQVDLSSYAVKISTNPALRHLLNNENSWQKIDEAKIPENLASLSGVQNILLNRRNADSPIYMWNGKGESGTLSVLRSKANFRATAEIAIRREVDRLSERSQLYIEPTAQAIEKVVVYSSQKDHGLSWQFHDPQTETPVDLQYLILDRSQHARWNVPVSGMLMELQLPFATKKTFGLVGTTSRTASLVETPTLVFLPSATEFRGAIQIEADSNLRIQPMTNLLPSSRTVTEKTDKKETANSFHTVGRWNYSNPSEELSLNVLNPDQKIALSATVFLESKISASDAYHIHTADFRLNPSVFIGVFEFQLDADTELLALALNGTPVRFAENGTLIQLPSLPLNRQNHVRIQYRQRAKKIRWNRQLKIPLPATSVNLLGMKWKLTLPSGVRLSETPDSMHNEETLSSPSWFQRFFGPLQVVYRKEQSSTATISDRNEANTLVLVSAFVPDILTISLQSQTSRMSVLWGLLSCGLFLSIVVRYCFSTKQSRAILMGLILLASAATVVLPETTARYSGSIFFGFVLSFLLRIGHRGEDNHRSKMKSQYAKDFSGFRLKTPVRLTGLLIVISFLSGSLLAVGVSPSEDSVSELQKSISTNEEVVLIPFLESEGNEIPLDVVYMKKSLKQKLSRELKRSDPQNYYISSASYRGISNSETSIKTVANLKVFLPEHSQEVEILLPYDGIVLEGENSCLVDGKPYSLRRSPLGLGYILDFQSVGNPAPEQTATVKSHVANYKQIEIELRFRVPIRKEEASGKMNFSIPPIADSSIMIDFGRTHFNLKLILDGQIVELKSDSNSFSTVLGSAKSLSLIWNDKRDPLREQSPSSFDRNTIVEISPGSLQVANSLKIEKLSSAISSLVLQIPSNAILRHLKTNSLKTYFPLKSDGDEKLIAVEFLEPQNAIEDFVWKYEIPRHSQSDSLDEITVPRSIFRSPLFGNFVEQNQIVGLTSRLDYELQIPDPKPKSWDVLQQDDAQTDALKFLSPVTPVAIYRVNETAELHCALALRRSIQEAIQKQSFRFGKNGAEWILQANIRHTGQRRFRYSLNIDPRIQVETVSVLKDRVERLARWNRHEDKINLILNESLSAPLQITIRGKLPFQQSQKFQFPAISWDKLDITDSILEIAHAKDLSVDAQKSQLPVRLAGSTRSDLDSEWWKWGTVRLDLNDDENYITLQSLQDVVKSEIVTVLESVSAERSRIRNVLRFSGLKKLKRNFEIPVPKFFAEKMTFQSQGGEASVRVSALGDRFLVIAQENLEDSPLIVSIVSEFDRPLAENWDLQLFQIEGLHFAKSFLVIDPESLRLAQTNSLPIRDAVYPEWVQSFLSADEKAYAVLNLRNLVGPLALDAVQSRSTPGSKITIPLAELSLWTNSVDKEQGSLRLHLLTQEAETLSITIPQSIQPHTLLVNRRQIPIPASEKRIREIPLDSSRDRQIVEIFWQKKHASGISFLGSLHHEFPFPEAIRVERTLSNVVLPQGKRTFSLRGASVLERPERLLQRLESLAEMGYGRLQSDRYREYETIQRKLNELFQSNPSSVDGQDDLRQRFEKVVSQTQDIDPAKKRKSRNTISTIDERFDRTYLLKNESNSGFHASLNSDSKTQFIEYRLWSDSATRTVSFVGIFLFAIPIVIGILRKPWFYRFTVPFYFRTCLLGAIGLMSWEWEWLGISLLITGLLQLAFKEKQRRQTKAGFEQPSSFRDTATSTIAS